MFGDVGGRLFFIVAANLTHQDDLLGLVVRLEQFQHINKARAVDGVATDADASALAHAAIGEGVDDFIGERAALGDHANWAGGDDTAGDNAHFGFAGGNQAGAVGANQAHADFINVGTHPNHV